MHYKNSKDEFLKNDIKNRTCYYFDDIMRFEDIDFDNILLEKNNIKRAKIFWFFTFYTKLLSVQSHCVLGSRKKMDLLKFMLELDI